jgi:hypothetical protein
VWAGEVVVVAGPDADELDRLLAEVHGRAPHATRIGESPRGYGRPGEDVCALAEAAARGGAVVAGVRLVPGAPGRRALAALRATIARRAPCRCVWLVAGRVYPE